MKIDDKYNDPIRARILNVRNSMIKRCYDESSGSYRIYGGRGIKVCDEWLNDKESFYHWALTNGFEKGLQIDRIDVNGNYEPSNCRWVTSKVNNNNRRDNRIFEIDGVTHTLSEWCDIYNIDLEAVRGRVNDCKWDIERALTTPLKKTKYYVVDGERNTINGFCKKLGLCPATVRQRMKYGYSIEEALSDENFMHNGNRTKRKLEKYGTYHVTFKDSPKHTFTKVER